MTPNNNLSALPWYTTIEQQNARKWWVYGRVYPLFVPAGYLLPFQILRESLPELLPFAYDDVTQGYVPKLWDDGYVAMEWGRSEINDTLHFNVEGLTRVYVENLPPAELVYGADYYGNVVFLDHYENVVGYQNLGNFLDFYTGYINIPEEAEIMYLYTRMGATDEKVYLATSNPRPIESVEIYTKDGELVGDFSTAIIPNIHIKALPDYDCIVYGNQLPFVTGMDNGPYYAVLSDGVNTWYSEIFTVVNDIAPYLKIEWWDTEDFVMDSGTIVYKYAGGTQFKNVLYLEADIAKPEYPFEEEGETRDGYFFPIKQISEKRYRFAFLASEYLLDVMRFIRMADYAQITKNGQTYKLDTFLITPAWEDNGDVASVEAEFDTATVAKKIAHGVVVAGGDFNKDFNKDFN